MIRTMNAKDVQMHVSTKHAGTLQSLHTYFLTNMFIHVTLCAVRFDFKTFFHVQNAVRPTLDVTVSMIT